MHNRPPIFPGDCAPDESMVRLPLFSQKPCGARPPRPPFDPPRPPRPPRPPKPCPCPCPPPCGPAGVPAAPPVCVVNPFNPCERATVLLYIDECGNLIVCVKR